MQNTAQDNQHDSNIQTLSGCPEGIDAIVLAEKAKQAMQAGKILCHIALDDSRVQTLTELLGFFAPEVEIIDFPAWDCLPYDRVSPNSDVVGKRVKALSHLSNLPKAPKPRVVLTTVNAITQKITPPNILKHASFETKIGDQLDIETLTAYLVSNGYHRTDIVREAGEYAIRGGIIDIFPAGFEDPVRLDLFGDEVDTIKTFDALNQTTTGKLEMFALRPAAEFFLNDESIERFRSKYRELFGAAVSNDPLYEAVSNGRRYNGMEHWIPLFFGEEMVSLLEYLGEDSVITFDHQAPQSAQERIDQIQDFYEARVTMQAASLTKKKARKSEDVSLSGSIYHPIPPQDLYVLDQSWEGHEVYEFSPFKAEGNTGGKRGRDFADSRTNPERDVFTDLKEHIQNLWSQNKKIVIAAYSTGARERLKTLLENHDLKGIKVCETIKQIQKLVTHEIGVIILPLAHGVEAEELAIITEQDILGDRLIRKSERRKRKADNFIREVSSLEEGDLVVHMEHGIGRFEGLETLEAAGTLHDCVKVVYAGDDRLFIPVEHIDVLSRFGSEEGSAQLDKLGGAAWQSRKARVKKDLMAMADDLLKIAAKRLMKRADKFEVSSDIYEEFTARFPYHETEDQLRSINDVKMDLRSGHPMDRLVCGDVGFGKTEVALRAAFIASMNGEQVAVVVPTTLLARQHFENFRQRFEGMGVRVAQLSRMVTPAQAKATKAELAEGTVQIVIGTHALLAQDLKFQNLGLLIVDEEQRFGVKQKEKLKALKENVHVLTLTATPIPRTLQMSLTGVKEMSIIATPPVDRLAVRTFVLPFDPVVIKEALLREYHRGGQSFYVCPRIKDLDLVAENLKELVPDLKVVKAHGQISAAELDERMTAFYDGQYDILLATNIIESGLDIPTANTMIVHRADLFGLAQLYQIRGRIGRSKVRAYAYLTYTPNQKLNANAQKRLEVMETLDTLGAGFQLASHDLDIRGGGNLLGEQQSGHIKEVGAELYHQMLEEAVAAARDGNSEADELGDQSWSPQINLGHSVLIPETYVEDLSVRLSLYRRLGELEHEEEVESFAAEMIDRFGPLPDEVENLLSTITIKQLCRAAGIDKLDAGPKGAVISFHQDHFKNVPALIEFVNSKPGLFKIRNDQKLVRNAAWTSNLERVRGVKQLLGQLAEINNT